MLTFLKSELKVKEATSKGILKTNEKDGVQFEEFLK